MNYISPTQLNMYLRCPAQYYFRYIEGLVIAPNAAMTKGWTVHKGIEENYKQKIETKKDMRLEDILEFTATVFEEKAEETEWDEDKGKTKDEAIQLISLYHTSVAPTVQPVCVEQRIEVPLEDIGINLLGFIDLVDSEGYIRDTKTARRSPAKNAIDKNLQLSVYSLAYRKLTGRNEQGVKLDYLVQNKTPKVVTLETKRTEDDLLRLQSIIQGVVSGIKNNVFYPNIDNYLCSEKWCGYWNECHKLF